MSDYTVTAFADAWEVGTRGGEIIAACRCGDGLTVPDEGFDRTVAAWKTHHQDC